MTKRDRGQWILLALLVLSVTINYIDRGNLSISASRLSSELQIDPERIGLLLSSFFWTYAAMQIVAGWLIDRYSVYWIFAAGRRIRQPAGIAAAARDGRIGRLPCLLKDHCARIFPSASRARQRTNRFRIEVGPGSGPDDRRGDSQPLWLEASVRRRRADQHVVVVAMVLGHVTRRAAFGTFSHTLRPRSGTGLVGNRGAAFRLGDIPLSILWKLCLVFSIDLASLVPGSGTPLF
jgi:Major Facilitator Superfamily